MGFGKQVARAGRDPWLLVTSGVGGGLAWAVLPVAGVAGAAAAPVGLGIAAAMWGVGAVVGALSGKDEDDWDEEEVEEIGLRPGTPQATMVRAIHGYVTDLEDLRASPLPDSVLDQSITALVAAQGAEQTAVRVAAAVDGLDDALRRSRRPPGQEPRGGALAAVQRMAERRTALLTKLQHSVDQVAEVYTKLLEMRASVAALDVGDGADEVTRVNASLDALRGSLAELEDERRALP
jgi:hypothetical protein